MSGSQHVRNSRNELRHRRDRAWSIASLCERSPRSRSEQHAVSRTYVTAPPSPQNQTAAEVDAKSAGCMSCHTKHRSIVDALQSGGEARLHRLSRRRRDRLRYANGAARGTADLHERARASARTAALSRAMAVERESRAHLYAAEQREPGIRPLRQPVGLSRRARSLRCMPHGDHRSVDPQHALDRRDAVGRRGVQQRHPAIQALHARRIVRPQRRRHDVVRAQDSRSAEASGGRCGHPAQARSAAGVGNGEARRRVPRVRTRRPQHRQPVSGNRPAQLGRASCSASKNLADPTSVNRIADRAPARASRCRSSTSPRRG